jgi:hypothetical protein
MAADDFLTQRARACGDRIAQLEDELETERGRREKIVIGMRDAGESWKAIGAAVRLSQSRCSAIVAEADPVFEVAQGHAEGPLPGR